MRMSYDDLEARLLTAKNSLRQNSKGIAALKSRLAKAESLLREVGEMFDRNLDDDEKRQLEAKIKECLNETT